MLSTHNLTFALEKNIRISSIVYWCAVEVPTPTRKSREMISKVEMHFWNSWFRLTQVQDIHLHHQTLLSNSEQRNIAKGTQHVGPSIIRIIFAYMLITKCICRSWAQLLNEPFVLCYHPPTHPTPSPPPPPHTHTPPPPKCRCSEHFFGGYFIDILCFFIFHCNRLLKRKIQGEIWCVFCRFNLGFIFCLHHCSDVCKILLYWTALWRHATVHCILTHHCSMLGIARSVYLIKSTLGHRQPWYWPVWLSRIILTTKTEALNNHLGHSDTPINYVCPTDTA